MASRSLILSYENIDLLWLVEKSRLSTANIPVQKCPVMNIENDFYAPRNYLHHLADELMNWREFTNALKYIYYSFKKKKKKKSLNKTKQKSQIGKLLI